MNSLQRVTSFGEDVAAGLSRRQKSIPPRHFYDALGSALFSAICELPEYYLTRAESEILTSHRRAIAAALGNPSRLIELGSGSSAKTRLLLDELPSIEYVPLDIDATVLATSTTELSVRYPELTITPMVGDLRRPSVALRLLQPAAGRTAALFLGSTIGNLDRQDAVEMMRDLRTLFQPGDILLLGADLRKSKSVLEAAYNDALGVTAAFNLNLLARINREFGGAFDLRTFAHRAFYDEEKGRIEMHLVSLRRQTVRIDALSLEVSFEEGETIHTENSQKYDDDMLREMAAESGFTVADYWKDSRGYFADYSLCAL